MGEHKKEFKQERIAFRKAVGERIRRKRLENNLCQEGLANHLGGTVGCISCWENGRNCLSLDYIYELARCFRINPKELLADISCYESE